MKYSPVDFKNYVLFAGFSKEQFADFYPKISEQMCRENRVSIGIFSALMVVFVTVLYAISFFAHTLDHFRLLYLVMLVVSVGTFALNLTRISRKLSSIRLLLYFYVAACLDFAIVLGTVFSPDELATTFSVLLIIIPLLVFDRPLFFNVLLLCAYLVFVVTALLYKSPDTLSIDLINASVFYLLSTASCTYMLNIKFQKAYLVYAHRLAEETDVLTGIRNRTGFEHALARHPLSELEQTYFIYADCNSLHEINNELGHEVGDSMLKCTASALCSQFGEKTFRIGGDEFTAFGYGMNEQEVASRLQSAVQTITDHGYSVAVGYAFGNVAGSMNELIKLAEAKMYQAKADYYTLPGNDRRQMR